MTPLSEAVFTAARPHCPHPERWHTTDIQSTELEVTELVAAMVRALQPDHVLETGTSHGNTAVAIGRALVANGQGHLVTIERDRELARQAAARCAGLPVTVVHGDSLIYTPGVPLDLLWLDSDIDSRWQELVRYRPHMHTRTVVGVHDTGPQHAVRASLEPLIASGVLHSPLWLPTPRGVAFATVTPLEATGG